MREIKELSFYLASVVFLLLGIWAAARWTLDQSHSLLPYDSEAQTTAAASTPELASEARSANDPFRQPVWIEPTKKYVYNPVQVLITRPDLPNPAARKTHKHEAAKPRRQPVVSGEARRAYGAEGPSQQLLILPLQHQAPN